jgi:hypothetical protein
LILFAFSALRHHHSDQRFGRRFGITLRVKSAAEKCLFFFGLVRYIGTVRASVNP